CELRSSVEDRLSVPEREPAASPGTATAATMPTTASVATNRRARLTLRWAMRNTPPVSAYGGNPRSFASRNAIGRWSRFPAPRAISEGGHDLFGDVEVRVDGLDVVEVIER